MKIMGSVPFPAPLVNQYNMTQPTNSNELNYIQRPVTNFLKGLGFTHKRRTYNRMVEDDIVQVISFQCGVRTMVGKFTVNLGVYLPCVANIMFDTTGKTFCEEYSCEIRARLGRVAMKGIPDKWWKINESRGVIANILATFSGQFCLRRPSTPYRERVGSEVVDLLKQYGLPFLDQFKTYTAILEHFEAKGVLPEHTTGRSKLVAAIVAYHLGDKERSDLLFEQAKQDAISSNHRGFLEHVNTLQLKCIQ